MMSDKSDGQAASKMGVGVGGGRVGSGVAVRVAVGVGGKGVGVSGMISLVAARQARVEKRSASVQKVDLATERVCMMNDPFSVRMTIIV